MRLFGLVGVMGVLAAGALSLTGCHAAPFECSSDGACQRSGSPAGICVGGACAFPASMATCTSGYRYDESAGGGLAGQCVGVGALADARGAMNDAGPSDSGLADAAPRDRASLPDAAPSDRSSVDQAPADQAPGDHAVDAVPLIDSIPADLAGFCADSAAPADGVSPTLASAACSAGNWCWATPAALRGVSSVGPTEAWSVGDAGTVLRYDGVRWASVSSSTHANLASVYASKGFAVAVGSGGSIIRYSTTTGSTWVTVTSGVTQDLHGVAALGSGYVAVGNAGTILTSSDAFSWSGAPAAGATDLNAVWAADATHAWAVGTDAATSAGKIYFYNGTTTNTAYSMPGVELFGVWGTSASDVWAVGVVGSNSVLLHFDGMTWTDGSLGFTTSMQVDSVWGTTTSNVWAVGQSQVTGFAEALHFNGTAWSVASLPYAIASWSVAGSAANDVWAVGIGGSIFHSTGCTFATVEAAPPFDSFDVWGSSPTNVYFVGRDAQSNGAAQLWNGTSFAPVTISTTPISELFTVGGTALVDVHVGGGGLYHWNGSAWAQPNPGFGGNVTDLSDIGTTAWVVGSGFAMQWNGTGWAPFMTGIPPSTYLTAVVTISSSDAWALDGSGNGYHFTGTVWSPATVGAAANSDIWASDPSDVWAVGATFTSPAQSKLYHYDGTLWHDESSMVGGQGLQGVGGTGPGDVWLVGLGGTIFHYNGTLWTSVPSPTTQDLYRVWSPAPGQAWIAGEGAILYEGP
jgi:hypothetical protein